MIRSVYAYLDTGNGNGSFFLSGVDESSLQEMRMMESMVRAVLEHVSGACTELEVQNRVKTLMEGNSEQRSTEQVS